MVISWSKRVRGPVSIVSISCGQYVFDRVCSTFKVILVVKRARIEDKVERSYSILMSHEYIHMCCKFKRFFSKLILSLINIYPDKASYS